MNSQLELFPIAVQSLPPSEVEKKDAAMRKMMESEQGRAELLRRAREARHLGHNPTNGLLRYRVPGMVTSDMVNDALGIEKKVAKTRDRAANHKNGAIFTVKEAGKERWRYLGHIHSKREGSNSRMICAWCLESQYEISKPIFDRVYDEQGRVR